MREATITLLGSGVCLGVYGPALSTHAWFRERGIASELVVLESCWREGPQADLLRTKSAFHRDFRLAMMGQKMAKRAASTLDEAKVTALLAGWKREGRRRFVVFSGFWAPILKRYLDCWPGEAIDLEICHMDAATPPSWRFNPVGDLAREVRLFRGQHERGLGIRRGERGNAPPLAREVASTRDPRRWLGAWHVPGEGARPQ